ncbi:ABC transporter permease [Nocardia sp. NPDC052566]|uniref:ABC transporter permease n=1 Tax=Nocardia sp. NPDC052566 TaxID=3364330 RepID=UPI0037C4FEDE
MISFARLLIRRIGLLIALLAAVFVAVDLLPGNTARAVLGRDATPEQIAAKEHQLGLDRPLPTRFLDWISGVATGDFGTTARGRPINDLLAAKFPPTLLLGGTAFALTVLASLLLGAWWASSTPPLGRGSTGTGGVALEGGVSAAPRVAIDSEKVTAGWWRAAPGRGSAAAGGAAQETVRAVVGGERAAAGWWNAARGRGSAASGTEVAGLRRAVQEPASGSARRGTVAFARGAGGRGAAVAAVRRAGVVSTRMLQPVTTIAAAVPEFVVATVLIMVFALGLGWLPAVTMTGRSGFPVSAEMVVLPVLALAIPQIGWNTRVVRAALVDAARAPHVESAVLDGIPGSAVMTRHILPFALPTIVASFATTVGMLLGGSLVVETIFNYPGLGALLAGSVADRDTSLVAAVVALSGAVIMLMLAMADGIRAWSLRGRR